MSADYEPSTIIIPSGPAKTFVSLKLLYIANRFAKHLKPKEIEITRDDLPFKIGRDHEQCNLVIEGETVSRRHCVIQLRDQQIGLLDTSSNGTYIESGTQKNVFIHDTFYPLVGQGAIKLGQKIDSDDSDSLHFKVIIQ